MRIIKVKDNAIIHYVNGEKIICSSGNVLFQSLNSGESWQKIISIPCSFKEWMICKSRLAKRLFRKYIYHVIPQDDIWTVFGFKHIYVISVSKRKVISCNQIQGSRPLVITNSDDDIFYGQYTSNPERNPITIFKSSKDKLSFQPWFTFKNIRHVHGIQKDPFSGKLYVTTGDNDDECFLGYFENKEFIPVVSGSQQARSIQLLFEAEFIYYATDAPNEENFIYRLNRKDGLIQKLQKVGGPVFYGFRNNGILFFSTVCEPSINNNVENVELWASIDGVNWKCIQTFKKDLFHMKLFQYGQIIFPGGPGNKDYLWFTPFATEHDQQILQLPLGRIKQDLKKD